jgi:parallel beta-helix repeat protein
MALYQTSYNVISDNSITNNVHVGINLEFSSNNTIINNNISDTNTGFLQAGIYLGESNDNMISGNTIVRNTNGIYIHGNNNIITENAIENNTDLGVTMFFTCNSNKIYHNNFIRNLVVNSGENNIWDDGIGMGNYWDWYTGTDCDGDGIGDTPFNIPGEGACQDQYPLIFPYGEESGVRITWPEKDYLYIRNRKVLPFFTTLLLGTIEIKANAANYVHGINRVEFYIDNIKRRIDSTPPYSWMWRLSSHIKHRHILKVIVFDNTNKSVSDEILVWKFF